MKKIILTALFFSCAIATQAQARKLSQMEWMDPKSMEIWGTLSELEKNESIADFVASTGQVTDEEEKRYVLAKSKECIGREAADPEYKDSNVPLFVAGSFCMTKYATIYGNKKK